MKPIRSLRRNNLSPLHWRAHHFKNVHGNGNELVRRQESEQEERNMTTITNEASTKAWKSMTAVHTHTNTQTKQLNHWIAENSIVKMWTCEFAHLNVWLWVYNCFSPNSCFCLEYKCICTCNYKVQSRIKENCLFHSPFRQIHFWAQTNIADHKTKSFFRDTANVKFN